MWIKITLATSSVIVLFTLIGCATQSATPATGENSQAAVGPPAKGGAQLWAETCSRCHNLRPADSYNDAQWQAVMQHMRLRANLDGNESRLITAFLQASH